MGLPVGRKNGFVEIVFRQDLQDLHDFIFYFQFPGLPRHFIRRSFNEDGSFSDGGMKLKIHNPLSAAG
jgi:hypothetical protein